MKTFAILILMLLNVSCAAKIEPAVNNCSWVTKIGTSQNVHVRGSVDFRVTDDRTKEDVEEWWSTLLYRNEDVLTPGTAGQTASHNRAVKDNCNAP